MPSTQNQIYPENESKQIPLVLQQQLKQRYLPLSTSLLFLPAYLLTFINLFTNSSYCDCKASLLNILSRILRFISCFSGSKILFEYKENSLSKSKTIIPILLDRKSTRLN